MPPRRTFGKIPAFTLAEVMITMAVSGIVILFSYAVLSLVNGYFKRGGEANEISREWLSFRTMMASDAEHADSILPVQGKVHFYTGDTVISWSSGSIHQVRQNGNNTQVFVLGPHSRKIGLHPELNYINRLSVSRVWDGDSLSFHFHKIYSVHHLINR